MNTKLFVSTLATAMMLGSAAFAQSGQSPGTGAAPGHRTENCVGTNCRATVHGTAGSHGHVGMGRSSTHGGAPGTSNMGATGTGGMGAGGTGAGSGAAGSR